MTTYSIDTCILADIKKHPKEKDLLNIIRQRMEKGQVFFSEEVVVELERGNDDLAEWIKRIPGAIIKSDNDIQARVKTLMDRFPGWINPNSTKNYADPFVIATAMKLTGKVVTNETYNINVRTQRNYRNQNPHLLKIPNICEELNVPCLDLISFLLDIGKF